MAAVAAVIDTAPLKTYFSKASEKTDAFFIFSANYKLLARAEDFLEKKLAERIAAGNHRTLKIKNLPADFCSNDYLGFAHSLILKNDIEAEIRLHHLGASGSTGSRLLSGNSWYAEQLEEHLAGLYNCEAALLFNSGYDANLGLFSSLPQRGDTIITDELIHASVTDGCRLSFANRYTFGHNDLESLERKLQQAKGNCFVAIESVYSMDGDTAPIVPMLELTERYSASLIVDEAHATGIFGIGLVPPELRPRIFATLVTFGKALGCHGAVVLGSRLLKDYLVNFARSFIYTTAMPPHQLAAVKAAFSLLAQSANEVDKLKQNISLFKSLVKAGGEYPLIESDSAIQCILLRSNEKAKALAAALGEQGLDVRPILSPTVPKNSERIRICLHSFNDTKQITLLAHTINTFINAR